MSKTLKLAADLSLPLTAVTETFGILAARGAGKSNAAAVLAEQMFDAGLPFVVIDPVGSWYGLRAGADGQKGGGLPIPIFGGKHGDVPLERGGGELLADLVVSKRLSCVLDLTTFESEGAKKTFLLDFARRLYQKNEDPLHLFLEEADDYIPQKPLRDEAQLLRAWENIVRRGRARGLGMTLITQRSASLNKSVLTQVQTLFVLRTTGPQDRAAIEAWVKYHDTDQSVLASLSGLNPGEGWVWSPQFLNRMSRHQFHRRRTFDSGATPKNLRGKEARAAATLADVDLPEIRTQMTATIERAKADDPKELRRQLAQASKDAAVSAKRISELEVRIASTSGFGLSNERAKKEVPVLTEADRALVTNYTAQLRAVQDALVDEECAIRDRMQQSIDQAIEEAGQRVQTMLLIHQPAFKDRLEKAGFQRILEKLDRVAQANPNPGPIRQAAQSTHPHREPGVPAGTGRTVQGVPARRPGRSGDGARPAVEGGLTGPEQRILDAIAWLESVGNDEPELAAVAFLAGYTVDGGAFNNPKGKLRGRGLVEYLAGGRIRLTSEGRLYSNKPAAPLSSKDLQTAVLGRLPGPEQRLLQPLIAAYPQSLSTEELANRAGYTAGAGAFNNPRGRLRSLGLIEYPQPGFVVAKSLLFLEGR